MGISSVRGRTIRDTPVLWGAGMPMVFDVLGADSDWLALLQESLHEKEKPLTSKQPPSIDGWK